MFGIGKDRKNGSSSHEGTLEEALTPALGRIQDPDLKRDLAALGAIRDLSASPQKVSMTLELALHSHPHKADLEAEVRKVIAEHAPQASVDIKVTANVRAAGGGVWGKDALPGVQNVILVASGKGGVGKSTVASNLAVALAQDGAKVGLLDADIYGPSIPTMFGVHDGVTPGPDGNTMVPVERFGLKVMSIGFMVDTSTPMVWRGPMIAGACLQLFNQVAWAPLDYLIVDLPPGTGDIQLSISQKVAVAGAVIVSTPQDVALADVVRAKVMFDKVSIPSLGVIENMSWFICDGCNKRHDIFATGGAKRSGEKLGVPFLGALPLETDVRVGGDAGTPVVLSKPDSAAAKALKQAAQQVALAVAALAVDSPRQEPEPPARKSPLLRVLS